jgi:WD40 repeat protein
MQGLNNIVSASLDTTVRIWDTYTEQETNKLVGHNKGVFSLSYNPEHRFIVSAGFDHDAYIWSPFVNTLLFKLKGHTSSLVGCQCVENSNELVTADSSGMFKIWDLRNFMCCQTFTSEHDNEGDLNDLTGLSSFAHVKLPAGGGTEYLNPEDNDEDYRVICGTKRLFFFDQFRAKTEVRMAKAPQWTTFGR